MFFDIVLSIECSNASKGQYNYAGKPAFRIIELEVIPVIILVLYFI